MPNTVNIGQRVIQQQQSIHAAPPRDHSSTCDGLSCDSPVLPMPRNGLDFEQWLSKLAEDQPYLYRPENLRRRALFEQLSGLIAMHVEWAVHESISGQSDLPTWLSRLVKAWHQQRSSILTFNYDTLVEATVDHLRLKTPAVDDVHHQQLAPYPIPMWAGTTKATADYLVQLMFRRSASPDLIDFVGDPSDDAAHQWLLEQLQDELHTAFIAAPLTNQIKGNLGEAIAFCIGHDHDFAGMRSKGANFTQCTGAISRPDVDIVWIRFAEHPQDDHVWLQEVKTTGAPTLALADGLISDYDKLFQTDVRLTLNTRLTSIAVEYRHLANEPDKADRLLAISDSSVSPAASPQVSLVPTIIHECSPRAATTKLLAIRTTLIGRGWEAQKIAAWSVRLGQLDARLGRLSKGQP
jgi:hypothetical protein